MDNNNTSMDAVASGTESTTANTISSENASAVTPASANDLPDNRFELELEFLQALASPAYLHYLATSRDTEDSASADSAGTFLQDPNFQQFLVYLRDTYSQPDYARFLQYPHSLYFLNVLIEQPNVLKEWTLPAFRNFCHQQQFLAWQYRHSVCYGVGRPSVVESPHGMPEDNADGVNAPSSTLETSGSMPE